jgi:DeoR/GlpR family transcriptional regulator of sugar metabolism
MAQVASLAEVDRVITSGPIPEEEIARMRDLGLEVIVADEDIEPGLKLRRIVP